MSNITIILRVTSSCNLACTYCYDKTKRYNNKPNELFKNNIDNIINYIEKFDLDKKQKINVVLHGGEPLLLEAKTYELFFDKITKRINNISFSIQTNGTLLNDEKLKILKKYNVHIGISLDGCNEQQNKNRIYPNGKNSFKEVKKTIDLLNSTNTKFGIIMTLSKNNLNHEEELYDFIKTNNIYCNVRPAFPTKQTILENELMSDEEYIKFFIKLFNLWYDDKKSEVKLTQIGELYDEFIKVMEPKRYKRSCTDSENCFKNFVSIDIEGNVYTCNRTYNEKTFYLGNLNKESIEQIKDSANKLYIKRKNNMDKSKCMNCEILEYCNGGCPANSYYLYDDFTKPYEYFCKSKKAIYQYVKQKLEREGQIEKYKAKKLNSVVMENNNEADN